MDQIMALLMGLFFLIVGIVCIAKTKVFVLAVVTFFRKMHQNEQFMDAWEHKAVVLNVVRFFGFLALLNFTVQLAYLVKG
ncbi:MAG: hypothetical protein GXP14_08405 [Gammaproteobacteria bacterium]|nr:hypothetical protein [Gammaproteobacteria bacterium]